MKAYALPSTVFEEAARILREDCSRTRVIRSVALLDLVLQCGLRNHFAKGNAKSRQRLFGRTGVFSSFASKADICFCAGWISSDLYHDLGLLRGLRNDCAHDVDTFNINADDVSQRLAGLRTPERKFFDWGQLKHASLPDGSLVIFSGEPPQEVYDIHDFTFPGAFGYREAFPILLHAVMAELEIPMPGDDDHRRHLADALQELRGQRQRWIAPVHDGIVPNLR